VKVEMQIMPNIQSKVSQNIPILTEKGSLERFGYGTKLWEALPKLPPNLF
jgi:hypothetical protein